MHFGYWNLQNIPCIMYCAMSKTSKFVRDREVKITLLVPTLEPFWCYDVFNTTLPYWDGMVLQFSVKYCVPQYTKYVCLATKSFESHPYLIETGKVHDNFSSFFKFSPYVSSKLSSLPSRQNMYCNYLHCLFDYVDDVKHFWLNV